MHLGNHNPGHKFTMRGTALQETQEERDIGVSISSDLRISAQCARAAKTAQAVLGQILHAFHYRDRNVFAWLYKQYVRPHLEFATAAWSPWTTADRDCLEKVQRRAIAMVSGLTGKTYEENIAELEMLMLEERRRLGPVDVVQMNGTNSWWTRNKKHK
jgi:hypothetical protein